MNYDEILGINQSTLKHFHNPKSLAHALLGSKKKFDNETLSFGRLVHSLILEPELFESQYIVADKPDCRTTAGKKQWAETLALTEQTDKQLISTQDFEQAQRMRRAVDFHKQANSLLREPVLEPSQRQIEQLLTGVLEDEDGVQHAAKGRADCILLDVYTQPVIVDLKTTDDASAKGFSDSCAKYAYHLQAAFYIDLLAAAGQPDAKFIFVAVEKQAPYGVQVFEADDEFIRMGRIAYKRALKLYALCKKLDLTLLDIPAYSENIEQLSLPRWA
jgi:hypothetical protein